MTDDQLDQPIISGALKTIRERRVVEKAAEEVDETISTFVRRACLRRAVAVARSLRDPEEKEANDAQP